MIDLGLPHTSCNWVLDFLSSRPQVVQIGPYTSGALILNTCGPQECVLSTFIFASIQYKPSFILNDDIELRLNSASSNLIIKFADDTTVNELTRAQMKATTATRSAHW